ncbi:MAG: asparagine synthetase B [Candidatus Methanoperedens sp.]|nr:asparagine synthetase B [Candidatus Methanoperedens sp.]MCE8425535.1 asparagine synthetase B [Candidatus Methanoperedens sp.]MCE8426774.1 asparagine synthetase B [Candidatus Methanoperedens sp.]
MCGIAGATGDSSKELVQDMLDAIRHRGPDGSGTFTRYDITLGNVLLEITGERPQPITDGGALVYNGEIYNFKDIAEKLNIRTDSDSETLFALIKKKGLEKAIAELDGDYSFAFAEDGKIYIARDPVGVKPLFYSIGEIFAFASEKKALFAAGMDEICALRPGHMLTYSTHGIIEKKVTGFETGGRITDENAASDMLYKLMEQAVKKRNFKPCAIAFSGGLDSSFIAALASDPDLYSIGMKGSHDIQQTRYAAKLLGKEDKLHLFELTTGELESAIPEIIRAIESDDPQKVSIATPLYFASKKASKDGIRVMLSGQGADELFAGYKRYVSKCHDALELALRIDIENISKNNLERDDAAAMANSVELRVPFLDKKVIELALRIDAELKVHNGIRKYILRKAAHSILPDELLWKEKKAAQYSSGVYPALEKLAKKNGFSGERFTGRYLESISKNIMTSKK